MQIKLALPIALPTCNLYNLKLQLPHEVFAMEILKAAPWLSVQLNIVLTVMVSRLTFILLSQIILVALAAPQ